MLSMLRDATAVLDFVTALLAAIVAAIGIGQNVRNRKSSNRGKIESSVADETEPGNEEAAGESPGPYSPGTGNNPPAALGVPGMK